MNTTIFRSAVYVSAIFAFYIATAMLIPGLVDLAYGSDDWKVFAASAGVIGALAALIATATRSAVPAVSPRLAFLTVIFLWLTFAAAGAVPFLFSSLQMDAADAFFESMSAITTTGSTVIADLDRLPPGLLLWRSILQWLGGLGVIALGIFVLPYLRVSGASFFRIESSDRYDRPVARFATFARSLLTVYVTSTAACIIAYWLAGMSGLDAVNHAFTTVSTGGFSTHNASMAYFDSMLILWISTFFMIAGALPFTILIALAIRGRIGELRDNQIVVMLGYTVILTVLLTATHIPDDGLSPFETLTHAMFNTVSLITTTGYASIDYSRWGDFAIALLLLATLLGGCSGSTSGGIKADRWIILYSIVRKMLDEFIYPHAVKTVRNGRVSVSEQTQRVTVLYFTAFLILIFAGTIALTAAGTDIITASTGTLTALANVGPGFGPVIGPVGNFASLGDLSKWVLSALMLLGRLEIFAVLILLSPAFWRA